MGCCMDCDVEAHSRTRRRDGVEKEILADTKCVNEKTGQERGDTEADGTPQAKSGIKGLVGNNTQRNRIHHRRHTGAGKRKKKANTEGKEHRGLFACFDSTFNGGYNEEERRKDRGGKPGSKPGKPVDVVIVANPPEDWWPCRIHDRCDGRKDSNLR